MAEDSQSQMALQQDIENKSQDEELVEDAVEGDLVSEEEPDPVSTLTAALEESKAQAAEYLDGWQRARAEFANYRRRQEQQQQQMDAAAKARVLTLLLPVVDDLERALDAVPEDLEGHAWVNGLSLVGQKWLTAMEKAGLSPLAIQAGDPFDPTRHEALTHEPSDDFAAGTIIQVVQRGYVLGDAVLRPALVRVSCGNSADD